MMIQPVGIWTVDHYLGQTWLKWSLKNGKTLQTTYP